MAYKTVEIELTSKNSNGRDVELDFVCPSCNEKFTMNIEGSVFDHCIEDGEIFSRCDKCGKSFIAIIAG